MRFLLFFLLLVIISCSTSSRQLFFDIPPPNEQELAEKARQEAARSEALSRQEANGSGGFSTPQDNLPPPDVESHLSWARAQEELPENEFGGIDWTAALEQGLVRPRTGADPKAKDAAAFKYDFIIEGKKPKFDAIFPHSAHTAWLGCQNCHTALYPYRRNTAKMKEMRKGASCGACHGKVAFSLKQCKRCHINM